MQAWRFVTCNPIQYQWLILFCIQRWEWESVYLGHWIADKDAAGTSYVNCSDLLCSSLLNIQILAI